MHLRRQLETTLTAVIARARLKTRLSGDVSGGVRVLLDIVPGNRLHCLTFTRPSLLATEGSSIPGSGARDACGVLEGLRMLGTEPVSRSFFALSIDGARTQ